MYALAEVTIPAGTALSNAVSIQGYSVVGVKFPAAWTAADVSFQWAAKPVAEGGTFGEVFIDPGTGTGAALLLDAAANQATFLNGHIHVSGGYLIVRSGPSGGPVNQAAARVVTLILRST